MAATYTIEHQTTGQWEDTEDLRTQDAQVIGTRKVLRDRPNLAETVDDDGLAAFLADLKIEPGERVRITREDDPVPD
jgi:hypothetical protein